MISLVVMWLVVHQAQPHASASRHKPSQTVQIGLIRNRGPVTRLLEIVLLRLYDLPRQWIGGGAEMMSIYCEEGATPAMFMDNGNLVLREMHPQPHQGVDLGVLRESEEPPALCGGSIQPRSSERIFA